MSRKGKHLLLDILRSEGVEHIFGNPGTTELPLLDALAAEDTIRYILGLNEVVVMGMADGYAQASGRVAVANLHAAPGLGNAMGMLYNAARAGAPILVTAGQQDTSIRLTEPLLWDDLATMARPLVKWSFEISSIYELPRALRRAIKIALTPPMGPVFLSIPGDILEMQVPEDLDKGAPTRIGPKITGDHETIAHAAALINAAKNPIILAGDACREAHAETAALADHLGAPVYLEGMANTAAFPSDHPLYAGSIARMTPAYRKALAPHDLIISLGADLLTQSQAAGIEALPPGQKLVHLDDNPHEIGKNFPAHAAILGNLKATLPHLTASLSPTSAPARAAQIEQIAAARSALRAQAQALQSEVPLHPLAVLETLRPLIPENAIIIEELLSSGMNTVRHLLPATHPDSWFGMRGGGIGCALPWAAGMALAKPGRPIVALSGDGSLLYSAAALWTLAHYQLPAAIVVFNNMGYRILKQRTKAIGGHSAASGRFVAMDLDQPAIDFQALARAHGVAATLATTHAQIAEHFTKALQGQTPTLIEIPVSRDV